MLTIEQVCTDIFGRGLDVERLNVVFNYDAPGDADSYLHRVGYVFIPSSQRNCELIRMVISRAGRFGTKGLAISFISNDDNEEVLKLIQSRFEVAITELPETIDASTYSKSSSFLRSIKKKNKS